jgi:sugar phosphate isomerase/epimerase
MAHPISLGALTVRELAPPDIVSCAADGGFDSVGLRLLPATAEEIRHDIVGDTPLVRETARRIMDTGMRVLDIEIFRLTPDTVVADYRSALETGARFGAREALVAGNDPDEARLADRFAAFCDLAGEYGISANVEPMPWTDVKTFAQGLRVVERSARDNAGVLIDALHFDRGRSDLRDVAAAPRARLRYVQICDAPAERPVDMETVVHQARWERLMPGDGALDLLGILRVIPAEIPISLEIPMQALSRTVPALERTREMLAKMRRLLAKV